MKCRLAGDSLVILELGTTIEPQLHDRVVHLASALAEAAGALPRPSTRRR